MPFDKRLEQMQKLGNAPLIEVDAAIRIYERVVTAQAICESTAGPGAGRNTTILIPIFNALCQEVRHESPPLEDEK